MGKKARVSEFMAWFNVRVMFLYKFSKPIHADLRPFAPHYKSNRVKYAVLSLQNVHTNL